MTNAEYEARSRNDFLEKIANQRYSTAEKIDGSGFVSIKKSWIKRLGNQTNAVAFFECKTWANGKFGEPETLTEAELTNFVI